MSIFTGGLRDLSGLVPSGLILCNASCGKCVSLYSSLSWRVGQPASEKDWGIVQARNENVQFRGNLSMMVKLHLQVMRMKLFSLSIEVFFIPS